MPRLAVVYQRDSLSPFEISAACAGLCEPIWIIDREDPVLAPFIPLLQRFGPIVDSSGASVADVAQRVAEQEPDGVITFAEELPLAAAIAEATGLRFHAPETATLLTVKHLQREAFANAGVPSARFATAARHSTLEHVFAAAHDVGFPLVVKPEVGLGSRRTYRIDDEVALRALMDEIDEDVILEEMLLPGAGADASSLGDVLMVDSLVRDGEPSHLAVVGHFVPAEPFRGTGSFFPAHFDSEQTEQILRATEAAIEALGVRDSYVNTDLIMTKDGPVVLEVNGRMGGQVAKLMDLIGVRELVQDSIRFALRQEPRVQTMPSNVHQVAFCAMYQPPRDATKLVALDGLREVEQLPGVTELVANKQVGDSIDWREGTGSRLFTIYGVVGDHARLAALYEQVRSVAKPTYA